MLKQLSVNDQKKFKKLEFLEGYRGILAIMVLFHHSKINRNSEFINFITSISFLSGLNGFFVLSSFLLSYRLVQAIENQSYKFQLLCVLKYFIRRFFRVYFIFFIFVTVTKFGPQFLSGPFSYHNWTSIVTLGPTGLNHLWTFSPEIKYYFFIPIFCFIFANIKWKKSFIVI